MSRKSNISGFTLIELIVVTSIISVLLLFSFPLFDNIDLFSDNGGTVTDFARLADSLKKRAVEQKHDFFLHIDSSDERIWVTRDDMDEKQAEEARNSGSAIAGDTRILSLQFAGREKERSETYIIRFRKQGYSDFVLIQIVEDEAPKTLRIDPFLPRARIINSHVDFEECI